MRPIWLAARDGTAHARWPGIPWTFCGQQPLDPRYAWPEATRCGICEAKEAIETQRREQLARKTARGTNPQ